MARHYFTFAGVSSRDMHVLVASPIEIVRPEERVDHLTIPGRSGELTQVQGEDIYNSYIQTVPISVYGSEYIHDVERWLKGDGYVSFSSQPNLQQKARVINAVTLTKHSRNIDAWSGDVQFYCEPFKTDPNEETITVTTSGTTITNPGDIQAYPRMVITGSGAVSITMGGNVLVIPNLVSGWTVDSELQWVLQDGVPQPNAWSGDFPVIPTGNSSILFTGDITSIEITPRFRYL